MVFLGAAFCGDGNSLLPPATNLAEITSIQIFDGTYNQLFVTTDLSSTVNSFDNEWTYSTKMNASFDKNLDAGNSGFSVRNTDHVVIRRRELGQANWIVVFVKEIHTIKDFDIYFIDKYARSGVEYEYSISSFVNGVENSYVIQNVYSEFDGCYITDKDCLYGTVYDVDGCDTSRQITSQVLELLNSKYMSVVSHSSANCETGSISGSFLKIDEEQKADLSGGMHYRGQLKDRLVNRKPLILKIDDGRIWMVRTSGTVNDVQAGHPDLRTISFDWVEVGDVNDMGHLYKNGFSDVDSRWW